VIDINPHQHKTDRLKHQTYGYDLDEAMDASHGKLTSKKAQESTRKHKKANVMTSKPKSKFYATKV
jgi:hypothetical protein